MKTETPDLLGVNLGQTPIPVSRLEVRTGEPHRATPRSREDKANFPNLVEQNVAGIAIIGDDATIGYCNGCFADMIGYNPGEIVGRALLDFVPEAEQRNVVDNLSAQLFQSGSFVQIASSLHARDGSLVEVLVNASKTMFEGRPASIAVVLDVTARNRAQRELAATAALLAAEHDSSPDGILVVDPVGRILSVNRRFREMFSIPADMISTGEAEPLAASALPYLTDSDAFLSLVQYLRAHPDESSHDEMVLKDGRVFDRVTSPFKTASGEHLGRIWYFRDVTERRKADDSLRASEERFRMLVEEAPDAILLYDFDQKRQVGANKAAERLFGVSREDIVEHGLNRFFPLEQPDGRLVPESFLAHCERALTGEQVTYQRRIRRASGDERLCRATLVRLPSSIRLLRTSLVDITEQDRARRELASTAAILATEHDSSPDGILVIDREARILSVNRRFGEIFDIPDELLAARYDGPVLALAAQRTLDPEGFERRVRDLYADPDASVHDEMLLNDARVLDRFTAPFRAADGEYLGRIWYFRDITQRRKADESLRASEARFRMLVEEAPDAILLYDIDQDRLLTANKAAERLFGIPRDEILRREPIDFHPPEQPGGRLVPQSCSESCESASSGEEIIFERRISRPSGEERLCRVTLVRLPSDVHLQRASFVDITEQRAAEARLSELLRGTVARQEAERQRLARELHDALGQYLAVMSMKLELFGRSAADASPQKASLEELKTLTAKVGDEVNRLAWELRPAALDDIGLESAIRHFVDDWARRSGLRFDLHFALKRQRLPTEVETALYRILQEAVTNVVKHAAARTVGVILKASPAEVVMIIEDDGNGFEPGSLPGAGSARLGLLGMRERIAAVRGGMEIETSPGEGTTLIIRVALA